jgi:thiol-disulfide isomerase/thioredoxin
MMMRFQKQESQRRYLLDMASSSSSQDTEESTTEESAAFVELDSSMDSHSSTSNDDDDDDLWGKAVPLKPQAANNSKNLQPSPPAVVLTSDESPSVTPQEELQKRQRRSVIVAMTSVLLALLNYAYTFFHPITPVQLLADMQSHSAPMSTIGQNGKPTVVDFWAPWCENCKLAAPTLSFIEKEYSDRVNFILVNGDTQEAWPYIEAFGVDAIPHLALVSSEGDVETALIGPIPKSILEADLNVLLENSQSQEKRPLPHVMLDAFQNHPERRRVHFDQ